LSEDITKLRQYYHSILGQQKTFDEFTNYNIDNHPVNVLKQEIDSLLTDFPNSVPPFNPQDFFSHSNDCRRSYYNCLGIRSYISSVLGRLKISIDEPQETPITEKRIFHFVNDSNLKSIIERDFSEIQRAYISKCWKSVIILSGGTIEAILTDLLLQDSTQAFSSSVAPRQKDITRWNLSDLIKVCVDLDLISHGVEKLSHPLREYRNLVHPGRELREKLIFDAEEAKIALEVLNIVYRDLTRQPHH
jgi:hypothetical protein